MLKRIKRVFKSWINTGIEKCEDPIKILNVILKESREEIYNAHIQLKKTQYNIKELKSQNPADPVVKERVKKTITLQEKFEKKLETKIKKYAAKVKDAEAEIAQLKIRYETAKSLKELNQNVADFSMGDLSELERMKAKVTDAEIELEVMEEMGDFDDFDV